MQEITVSPGEIIFLEGDRDDSIYLILSGQIEIFLKEANRDSHSFIIKTLSSDQIFGEIAFFSEQPRSASARSKCFSTLCKIERKDFIQVIQQNQTDFEVFKALQHKITLNKDYTQIKMRCYACSSHNHIIQACPLLNLKIDHQLIKLKYNYCQFQERKPFNKRCLSKLFKAKNLINQNKRIFNNMKTEPKHQQFFNSKINSSSEQGLSNKKIEELKHQTNFFEEEEEFYFNQLYNQSIDNLDEFPISNKQLASELYFANQNKSQIYQISNKNAFKERVEDKELSIYQQSTVYDDQSLKQSVSALDTCSKNDNFTSKNSVQIRKKQSSLIKHNNFIENIQTDQSKQSLAFINYLDQESINVSMNLIAESNYPYEQKYHKQLSSLANTQLFPEEKKSVNWKSQETKIHKFCKDEQINNLKIEIVSQNSIRTLSSHDKQENGNSINLKSQNLKPSKKYRAEQKIQHFVKNNSGIQEQTKLLFNYFDQMKLFKYYFPQSNYKFVIRHYNSHQDKNIRKLIFSNQTQKSQSHLINQQLNQKKHLCTKSIVIQSNVYQVRNHTNISYGISTQLSQKYPKIFSQQPQQKDQNV